MAFPIILIGLIRHQMAALQILKEEVRFHQNIIQKLILKIEGIKAQLLELSQQQPLVGLSVPIEEGNSATVIILTLLAMFGIMFLFYSTSTGPIFSPVRTMSAFDDLGNQILIGIRYPVESPVSASIRLAGTPDFIPVSRFVKTITENSNLKSTVANDVVPVVLKTGTPLLENCKLFLLDIVHIFF